MAVVIFIVLAIIYFIFIRPIINPRIMKIRTFYNIDYMDSTELDRVIKEKQTVTIYSNKIVLSGYLNSSYNIIKSWETNSNFFFDCIKDNTVYRFMEHKHLDTITFYLRDLNKETYMFFNDNTF